MLNDRDYKILCLLQEQGFVTFEQILVRYFSNKSQCSRRLKFLENNHYVTSANAKKYLLTDNPNGHFFPYIQSVGIHPRTQIYYLNRVYRKQFPETNRLLKKDLLLHQLMLNQIRFFIEDNYITKNILLNDPENKIQATIDLTKRTEFSPDLTILETNFSVAIELERTMKAHSRYMNRFHYYDDSTYDGIIYYYINDSHLNSLKKYAGTSEKYGFSHYLKPEKIISNTFGFMSFSDWILKMKHRKEINHGPKNQTTTKHHIRAYRDLDSGSV